MLYCDYATYQAQGGTKTEAEFPIWARRASAMIDRLTYGRAKYYASDDEVSAQLADACCQIIDLLGSAADVRTRGYGLASAATTDGYSETFLDAAQLTRRTEADAFYILRDALGADTNGLCYLGVCSC